MTEEQHNATATTCIPRNCAQNWFLWSISVFHWHWRWADGCRSGSGLACGVPGQRRRRCRPANLVQIYSAHSTRSPSELIRIAKEAKRKGDRRRCFYAHRQVDLMMHTSVAPTGSRIQKIFIHLLTPPSPHVSLGIHSSSFLIFLARRGSLFFFCTYGHSHHEPLHLHLDAQLHWPMQLRWSQLKLHSCNLWWNSLLDAPWIFRGRSGELLEKEWARASSTRITPQFGLSAITN